MPFLPPNQQRQSTEGTHPSSKEHRTFYLTKNKVEGYWSVALSAGTTTEVVSRELLIDSTARLDASSKNCSLHK